MSHSFPPVFSRLVRDFFCINFAIYELLRICTVRKRDYSYSNEIQNTKQNTEESDMKSVKIENGNKQVEVTVIGARDWSKGDNIRIYFDLEQSNKRSVFSSFYQVLSGDTRDEVIEVSGKKFAFAFGVDCNSNTKRECAREAAKMLAEMIAE